MPPLIDRRICVCIYLDSCGSSDVFYSIPSVSLVRILGRKLYFYCIILDDRSSYYRRLDSRLLNKVSEDRMHLVSIP